MAQQGFVARQAVSLSCKAGVHKSRCGRLQSLLLDVFRFLVLSGYNGLNQRSLRTQTLQQPQT